MLVESAFSILPEVVAGFGFQRVVKEANAVGSFAYALLNTLHSKNVLEPLSRIQQEQSYATNRAPLRDNVRRTCDIFLDYGGSKIGTKALAAYGWRYRNYVEAKFFQSYSTTATGQDTNASTNTAELIADLIRLVALVPEPELISGKDSPKTATARYFLLLANSPPDTFLVKFMKDLLEFVKAPPLLGRLCIDLSTEDAANLASRVGASFAQLHLNLHRIACFAHYPVRRVGATQCWMLLMRIDAATLTLTTQNQTHGYQISEDRTLSEVSPGDYKFIRDFVATNERAAKA